MLSRIVPSLGSPHYHCLVFSLAILLGAHVAADETPSVDFTRDIQPIFAKACYECHGPRSREGGLRLSNRRDAFTETDSGDVAIIAGDAKSVLLERIKSTDETVVMPPPDAKSSLTRADIAKLEQWIKTGAKWPDDGSATGPKHWAYIQPRRPKRPNVPGDDWARNGIDYFVLARLQQEQLSPSPAADKARLIRRLYLTLTGLPPSVAEVDEFVSDDSPTAYEMVVDRLLQSERYGERWAQHWLDLARYADSNGYQADQLRDSWAYRDWVVKAINSGMSYDQFVIEQIAGDLLPDATVDQKIATGFHRTVTCNVEAGVHPEENRTNQVFDRVNTTGTVFLGTTLECCQCHNHKYDPFTQADYYRLFAYFNNTPLEVKQSGGVTYDFVGPKMDIPLQTEKAHQQAELKRELAEVETRRKELLANAQQAQKDWEREIREALKEPPQWEVLEIAEFASTGGESHKILSDRSVLLTGKVPNTTTYTIRLETQLNDVRGIRLEALADPSLPGKGPGRGDKERPNFILSELSLKVNGEPVALLHPTADYSQSKWEVAKSIDGNLQTGWAIGREFGKDHWAIYRLGEPVGGAGTKLELRIVQNYGRGRTIGRLRISAVTGSVDVLDLPENVRKILAKDKRNVKEKAALTAHFSKRRPEIAKLDKQVAALRQQLEKLRPPTTLVMVEMDKARETHVMIRGEYLNRGAKVQPGVPEILHGLDDRWPQNRLGLAKWLVSKDNPLTARVAVNRWWAEFFGRGIVASPEDLGTQCEPPTHPALLDWLAIEFMESGWSMRHVHKLMVMSATYRQSARVSSQAWEIDPGNHLLARGPRFRLSAETIRDNALAISGLLSTKMYGPPIMPYQPNGIWRAVGRNAPKWKTANDADRYRRGLYVVWRRAAPYPSFVNFDAPDRAACVVQRAKTNTPLQALTLLNDPAYVEMALALADRMCADCTGSPADRARYGMQRCVARTPTTDEINTLVELFHFERKRLTNEPATAKSLLGKIDGYQPQADVDEVELAAWFHVANVLLNLDETITP